MAARHVHFKQKQLARQVQTCSYLDETYVLNATTKFIAANTTCACDKANTPANVFQIFQIP